MMTTGNPSAKLGMTSAREDSSSLQTPSLSRNPVIRTGLADHVRSMSRFEFAAYRAVPDDDELEREAPGVQTPRRFDQQELALLLGESADVDEPWSIRDRRGAGPGQERLA